MPFRKFKQKGGKSGGGSTIGPRISLRKSGTIGLNNHTTEKFFDDEDYVELHYDVVDDKIGLSPLDEETEYSYAVRKSDKDGHGSQITCSNFLEEYGLVPEKTTRYPAQRDGENGLVIADLREHGDVYGGN